MGAGRRVAALSERARPGRTGRPARLRLCLGGRAPLPRGIFAFAGPRGVSRCGEPAHQTDPPRPRHHAIDDQPPGAGRRAHRRRSTWSAAAGSNFGMGESASSTELEPFGRAFEEKRAVWEDAVRAIIPMFKDGGCEYHGPYFDFPLRNVVPKPVQKPHPPLWCACSQLETIEMAGRRGSGRARLPVPERRGGACLGPRLLQRLHQAPGKARRLRDQPEFGADQLFHVRRDRRGGAPPRRRHPVLPVRLALLRAEPDPRAAQAGRSQSVGRIRKVEARQPRGLAARAVGRADRLARDDPAQIAAVRDLAYRPGASF